MAWIDGMSTYSTHKKPVLGWGMPTRFPDIQNTLILQITVYLR